MVQSIGIVGCGAIGQALVRAVDSGELNVDIAGVTSRNESKAHEFLARLNTPPPYLSRQQLIDKSDLLVETAGGHVVATLAKETFAAGKDLMVISIGALLEYPEVIDEARRTGCRLLAPSGAIAGLDGIKSACAGRVDQVTMISRKPPIGLQGAPYIVENGINLEGLVGETEVFSGNAREAVKGFPSNLNVSAAVSLAGIGPDRTQVKMLVVPGLERNCHEVEVLGEFGVLKIHIENIPSENPKTGKLTAFSIIRSVQDAVDPFRIGT